MARKLIALLLAAALLPSVPAHAQAPAATQPRTENPAATEADAAADVEPKFIWGILIKFIAGEVFSAFTRWVAGKITDGVTTGLDAGSGLAASGALSLTQLAVAQIRSKHDTRGGAFIARNPSEVPVGMKEAPPITMAAPSAPIKIDNGSPNYQGVHIAIVGADRSGTLTELRPVKAGFRTGERFKLRAVSTFGGLLVIENINPRGERRQIYPADRGAVVMLQPGADTLLPLGADEFFEFAKATGEEQLVISLRDSRAIGAAASKERVHRKDEDYGSHFLQEVSKDSYPVISESIRLQHN